MFTKALLILLIVINVYDLKTMNIPNWSNLLIILVGLIFGRIYFSGILVAVFLLLLSLFPKCYNLKGGGDIKLLGSMGLVLGLWKIFLIFLFSEVIKDFYRIKTKNYNLIPYSIFVLISFVILF